MSNKRLHYNLGKEIITEGDTACQSAYIIECGNVDVWKAGIGKVAELTEGAIFGEMAFITGEPRSATVIASSDDCVCREITSDEFKYMWEERPKTLLPVLRIVAQRLASTTSMINNLKNTLE
jgi:CRP-like cAMP-binding protein